MPKKVKKADQWKHVELTDEDKIHIKMAIACYIQHLGHPETTPKYSAEIAREIIPFVAEEDNKWSTVDKATVTQTGKIPVFKQYIDLVRSQLRSPMQMTKYMKLVVERKGAADNAEEDHESSNVWVASSVDEDTQIKETSLMETSPDFKCQKEMAIENLAKPTTDFTTLVGPSSTKNEGGTRDSPKLIKVDKRTSAERTEAFYNDMIVKIKEADDATNLWRNERDSMYFVQSPTNAPKRWENTTKFV